LRACEQKRELYRGTFAAAEHLVYYSGNRGLRASKAGVPLCRKRCPAGIAVDGDVVYANAGLEIAG
jgi:hypothetical protein